MKRAGKTTGRWLLRLPITSRGRLTGMSNVEDREQIAAALLQLDTLYREVLVLRFHEDLSLEEIAKVTRAPLSTVKSRLYRGMASIKPRLERAQARRPEAV